MYVPVHDKIRSEGFAVAANISCRSGGALTQYPLRPLVVCMCEMAGIVDDEEIARIIAESDSYWASESDDSFKTSLESDSSVPDKKT